MPVGQVLTFSMSGLPPAMTTAGWAAKAVVWMDPASSPNRMDLLAPLLEQRAATPRRC